MPETTRPSERVGGKRRMTDEEDGDDVEDGRRTRRRTEQERDEKEWRARIERILVQMDTREKRRAELDEQHIRKKGFGPRETQAAPGISRDS